MKQGEGPMGGLSFFTHGDSLSAFAAVLAFATACGGHAENGRDTQGSGAAGSIENGGTAGIASQIEGGVEGGAAGTAGAAGVGLNAQCAPGRAPLRRLSRFEYSNTVRDLLGDASDPGHELPPEAEVAGFSNNAAAQTVSVELAQAYFTVAKSVAARATSIPASFVKLLPCAADVSDASADACARTFIGSFARQAYRRALSEGEQNELAQLHASVRAGGGDFAAATAAVIAAVLQAPDFLYRLEWGSADAAPSRLRRPSGDEMATRLSYLFWGTQPDGALRMAAEAGKLVSAEEIKLQATRLLQDPRALALVAYFFDSLIPLATLLDASRSDPGYSPAFGQRAREATQRFLLHEIFERDGSWPSVLNAPYAFGDESIAKIYGVNGILGDALQKFELDPKQRSGLLTQVGVLAALTTKNNGASPSRRGGFIQQRILCRAAAPAHPNVPPALVTADGLTARERWTRGMTDPTCQLCHGQMDALGFALGNYDALGRYQTVDNGQTIDAHVDISGVGSIQSPVELAQTLATLPEAQACFVQHWLEFGFGKSLDDSDADRCLTRNLNRAFADAGFNIRQLLIDLTQTDAFLYLPEEP